MDSFLEDYFKKVEKVSTQINLESVFFIIEKIKLIKNNNGRIFFLGVGGSAGNASHAVNDFRKLCNIESYAPSDNASELTARINDEGWDGSYKEWLKVSNLNSKDGIFILSVGGGNKEKKVSINLIEAIDLAISKNASVIGIVGKSGGYTMLKGNAVVLVPEVDNNLTTPLSESFQAVIWHAIVSHPLLKVNATKW